jgi:hypothetical protein
MALDSVLISLVCHQRHRQPKKKDKFSKPVHIKKDTINRVKRHLIEWEKYLKIIYLARNTIYSKSLKLNNKKSDSKMDRELKQTFLLRRDANGQIST